jgi:CheY-like chemotaxis protein
MNSNRRRVVSFMNSPSRSARIVAFSPSFAILVVDDDPVAREMAVETFKGFGFSVFDAYNGQDALRLISANPEIGLLFTDVRMWGMRGVELAHEARKIRPDLKIVLTSGYPAEAPVLEFPFILKPWRLNELETICMPAARDAESDGWRR